MKILFIFSAVLLFCGCAQPTRTVSAQNEGIPNAVPGAAPPTSELVAGTTKAPVATTAELSDPSPDSLASRPDVQAFIEEMVNQHDFNRNALYVLFSRAHVQPEIIDLMNRPAEAKPWYAYRSIFLTPARIQGGVEFWNRNSSALGRAEEIYGVPAEIIVSIIGVETAYGTNTGRHRVLEALSTLAFDYPKRASFFRKELENYLLLTREEGIDPLLLKGSYAGAMGLGQFMPSSYRTYAVDFNGDQHRDLWSNPTDAIGSVAHYLAQHRWQRGEPIAMKVQVNGNHYHDLISHTLEKPVYSVQNLRQQGIAPQQPVNATQTAMLLELEGRDSPEYWLGFDNFYVITRYNHSPLYAMVVYQLGQEIRKLKS